MNIFQKEDPFVLAHKQVRKEILEDPILAQALREAQYEGAALFPSVGNLGDGLIQLGTFDLLQSLKLSFQTLVGPTKEEMSTIKSVVIGGGGGWVEGLYDIYPWLLGEFMDQGGKLLVLPSSISGFQEFFRKYSSQTTVFAREMRTFESINSIDGMQGRVHIAHDLAFATNPRRFKKYRKHAGTLSGTFFRTDKESVSNAVPFGNLDLALINNGAQWRSVEECERYLYPVAELMSRYATVSTDRLHMTALAAMIGRKVTMSANSYFKNEGVYKKTLSRFPNVTFSSAAL